MEFRNVGAGKKVDSDYWGNFVFSVILREPLSNFGSAHTHDRVIRSVVIGAPVEHFYADHALTQFLQITRQGVVYYEPEKVLAALAPGESIASNHRLELISDGLNLLSAEFLRAFEVMSCCHLPSLSP
jgi:hypothetical protein